MWKKLSLFAPFLAFISPLLSQNVMLSNEAFAWPIGTLDNTVSAVEYVTFLTDSIAPQAEETLELVQEKFIGDTIPIFVVGDPGNCTFLLKTAQMNELVKAVPTQEAQELFNEWRKNPTSEELFSYLDNQFKSWRHSVAPAQISKCKSEAAFIKQRYPYAPLFNGSTVFDTADWVAQHALNSSTYFFVNECNASVVSIPGVHMLDLQQSRQNGMYENTRAGQVSFLPGPHRPKSIQCR